MSSFEVTINYDKGSRVVQHTYNSELDIQDFADLMQSEWLINLSEGDAFSVEILAPSS